MVPQPTRPTFLRTPEAAALLRLSPRTLEKHRTTGTGPVYLKAGGTVLYLEVDLVAWAENGRRSSTAVSDQRRCAARPG